MEDDGIRNGFATSASNASTNPTATASVTTQSTTFRQGSGRRRTSGRLTALRIALLVAQSRCASQRPTTCM